MRIPHALSSSVVFHTRSPLSFKKGTKLEQLMKKLQEREKGMVAELEAERQARARLERLLQASVIQRGPSSLRSTSVGNWDIILP